MTRTNGSAGLTRSYDADALRDLGRVGITVTGHAYVYCERGAHYHIANARDVEDVRGTVASLFRLRYGSHRTRKHTSPRTRQPKRECVTTPNAADAFVAAFDAQRTRPHMTRHETRTMTLASIGA